jgi:hypothetical protein
MRFIVCDPERKRVGNEVVTSAEMRAALSAEEATCLSVSPQWN